MDETILSEEPQINLLSSSPEKAASRRSLESVASEKKIFATYQLETERRVRKGTRKLIEWSQEENIALFDKFVEIGSKWV